MGPITSHLIGRVLFNTFFSALASTRIDDMVLADELNGFMDVLARFGHPYRVSRAA